MLHQIGPLPAFLASWALAALLGAASLIWTFARARQPASKIAAVWLMNTALIVMGSKLLFLLEAWLRGPTEWESFSGLLLSPRMRIPGGILLAIALGPLTARIARGPFLVFADLGVPAAAFCLVAVRIGCFLEGCCFGTPSDLPWAVRFPPFTEVFGWQVKEGLIAAAAESSLPVHPLQLYFAVAALAIAVGLLVLQPRKRFDGEMLLLFLVSYLWSTWLLELLRAQPHAVARSVVLVSALATSALAVFLEWRGGFRLQPVARLVREG